MSSTNTPAQGDANTAAGEVAAGEGVVSLRTLGDRMLDEARAAHSGRAGRTVIALPGLRTTLLALAAGSELAEHQAPGSATLACLSGEVTLATSEREWRLRADDAVAIPEQRHRLLAEADALVLLTVRLD
ncbi:MAG TPA: cupin domain-containing protein [Actinocrinis sp.]|nr:cupin domain-containing protein [Actinocrinis sp.]